MVEPHAPSLSNPRSDCAGDPEFQAGPASQLALAAGRQRPTTKQKNAPCRLTAGGFASKSSFLLPALLGFLTGLCSYQLLHEGAANLLEIGFWLACAGYIAAYLVVFYLIAWFLKQRFSRSPHRAYPAKTADHHLKTTDCSAGTKVGAPARNHFTPGWLPRHFPLNLKRKSILLATVVIFIAWLPYLVSSFNGVYWYDTSTQLAGFFWQPQVFTDHHPFMDTLLFVVFAKLGIVLFHNAFAGTFLLILVNGLFTACSLGLLANYLWLWRVTYLARLVTVAFFALVPAFPIFFASLAKDTVFCPFFILFALMYAEVIRRKGKLGRPVRFLIVFFLLCLAVAFTKKVGAPLVLLALGSLALLKLPLRLRLSLPALGAATFFVVSIFLPATLYPAVNIQPGSKTEVISVPLQQLGYVAAYRDDQLADEDRQLLQAALGQTCYQQISETYLYYVADPIKSCLTGNQDEIDTHKLVEAWVKLLPNYFGDYLKAWGGLSIAWFAYHPSSDNLNLNTGLNIPTDSSHHPDSIEILPGWKAETALSQARTDILEQSANVPLFGLLMKKALWASFIPVLLLFLMLRFRVRGGVILLMPLTLSMLVLLVGPVSLWQEGTRYVFPMMCTAPLYLAMSWEKIRSQFSAQIPGISALKSGDLDQVSDPFKTSLPA